jgi:hypothetical protein
MFFSNMSAALYLALSRTHATPTSGENVATDTLCLLQLDTKRLIYTESEGQEMAGCVNQCRVTQADQ